MNTSRFLLAALVALLTACGGGDDEQQASEETNKPAWDCSYGSSQRIGGEVPRSCR